MRTANYVFSVISIILGIVLILFMLSQETGWNIGTAIGVVLVLNGVVRLWFAQDDHQRDRPAEHQGDHPGDHR